MRAAPGRDRSAAPRRAPAGPGRADARTKTPARRRRTVPFLRRGALALLLLAALAPAASQAPDADSASPSLAAAHAASPAFGAEGTPVFTPYYLPEDLPNAHGSGEPTIGIPWNTDHVFFQAFTNTHRAAFDDADLVDGAATVEWTDVTPTFTPVNVDPMIHADYQTGRLFAGGLAGPCSLMGISDDDGETWVPAGNMCSGPQFDHQSIGSGPWSSTSPDSAARAAVYPRATYYCAQLALTSCATSLDGGRAWLPFTEVTGPCGGLHGHIAVSEATGFAAVPHGGCAGPEATTAVEAGSFVGFAYTSNNGATWSSRIMPDAPDGEGFDPDLAFSQESGWLWLAQADALGVHIALSKDEGASWETLGTGMADQEAHQWLNLSTTFHDPRTGHPIVYGAFPDLEAGDDDRVALAFLGTTNPDAEEPFSPDAPNGACSDESDGNVWHYYLSQSFDGGATWTTTRIWEDPVQVGAIWNGGGGQDCRNLLDFNDMDMDSRGRLHIALADGCTEACSEDYFAWVQGTGDPPEGEDSRDSWGVILRQSTGRGLFAAHDVPEGFGPTPTTPADDGGGNEMPGVAPALLALAVVAVAWAARRRFG